MTSLESWILMILVIQLGATRSLACSPTLLAANNCASYSGLDEELRPGRHHGPLSLNVAVNIGLVSLDVQESNVYAFAAVNLAVPFLSKGNLGSFAIGLGISLPLTENIVRSWWFDYYLLALPGWRALDIGLEHQKEALVGIGVGVGVRYVNHVNGLVFGFKLPILGASLGHGGSPSNETSERVFSFFYHSLFALPIVSFGYNFY